MNIRRIFNPWSEIARLEDELSEMTRDRDHYRDFNFRKRQKILTLQDSLAAATAEISDLKANSQPRDPKTGRLVKRLSTIKHEEA